MRLGLVADIHGNDVALQAVLADAAPLGVDEWWALGDLVLFGSRPVEVLERLAALPGIRYLRGNTDRYVVTGEQPHPHATAADAARDPKLVERYGAMAAARRSRQSWPRRRPRDQQQRARRDPRRAVRGL